jgi:hypothetical protein
MAKASDEERSRNVGQPAPEFVEVTAAEEQLADDQWRPTVGKNLAGASNRTVLVIFKHYGNRPPPYRHSSSPKIGPPESYNCCGMNRRSIRHSV